MSIQQHIPTSVNDKLKLMKFIYDNTDSFILNTFGYLWESRNWWDKFPIHLYMVDDNIAGMHAFTVDTKAPDTIKTYYIITGVKYRNKGIAKKLTMEVLNQFKDTDKKFFVNSEEKSSGVNFYKKLFKDSFTLHGNEFGTIDYYFEASVKSLTNSNHE